MNAPFAFDVNEIMTKHDCFKKYKQVQSVLISGETEKSEPKFSIVIPTYKRVETLSDTIQSCLNQTGEIDYNVIVVDNNPERNDATELYIASLNNPKIKCYKNAENIGMTGNWNRCIELCEGEYAVLLHDDDILSSTYLFNVLRVLSKYPSADVLYVGRKVWRQNKGAARPQMADSGRRYPLFKATFINCLLPKSHVPTGLVLKKNSCIALGGFDERTYPSPDYYFFSYAVANGLSVYVYTKPLFTYRYSVNESLKEDTKLDFVRSTAPLHYWLMDRLSLPRFLGKHLLNLMHNIGLGYCKPETVRHAELQGISFSKILLTKGFLRKLYCLYNKVPMFIIKRYIYRKSIALDIL